VPDVLDRRGRYTEAPCRHAQWRFDLIGGYRFVDWYDPAQAYVDFDDRALLVSALAILPLPVVLSNLVCDFCVAPFDPLVDIIEWHVVVPSTATATVSTSALAQRRVGNVLCRRVLTR
jgi:hypothetical protein